VASSEAAGSQVKVILRKAGFPVGLLVVEPDGSITITAGSGRNVKTLHLTVDASRRIAGEVVRKSIEHTTRTMRGRARDAAIEHLNRLLPEDADE
jgi:hypothetical protein